MKKLFYTLPLLLMATHVFAGKVDFSATEGQVYQNIKIKLKATANNNIALNKGRDSVAELLSHQSLTATSLFYPSSEKGKLLKAVKPDVIAIKNGLDRYLKIILPENKKQDIKFINTLMDNIAKQQQVELVYPDGGAVDLSLEATTIPKFIDQQYYLLAPDNKKAGYALGGLNIVAGDNYPGGRGEGVSIITMEIAPWFTANTNLPPNAYPNASSVKQDGTQDGNHDTATVGVMVAKKLDYGIEGAAYKANKIAFVANSEELLKLLPEFTKGDIIQIGKARVIPNGSANCTKASGCGVPMEYYQDYYDVLKTATDKGIYVVEPAGNDNIDLDDSFFAGKFDRTVRDSGAIIVGAVCGEDGKKAYFSSYGEIVDVSAWGCFEVVSTGYGDLFTDGKTSYTAKYSGTSAANPQIAGVVANISGIAKKANKTVSPITMRRLLQVTGSKIAGEQNVGYYPNLKTAADYILNFGN